jgi:negative regulator of flagellin synthesis FlgM
MKIELGNAAASQAVLERSNTKQLSGSQAAASSSVAQDRTTLSSSSTSVKSLTSHALSSPEVRQDKVDALRQSVSSGEYKVDPNKIASAIVSAGGF